jgi:alpha-ketoglutarate-dependent taurine dioxygenase
MSFESWCTDTSERIISEYSALLAEHGYVHGTNVPDSLDHLGFFSNFGSPTAGPSGRVVEDVVPVPGMDDVYYGGNRNELFPHTEGYELAEDPPAQLALWCVVPVDGDGGETLLWDSRRVLDAASPDLLRLLETHEFGFQSSEGLRRLSQGTSSRHPILTRNKASGQYMLRFSLNNMLDSDAGPEIANFREECRQTFDQECVRVAYRRNDFIHWNNWRVLHSRTAFSGSRHLRRVQLNPTA